MQARRKIIPFPIQPKSAPWFGPIELQQQKITCLDCGNTDVFLVETQDPLLVVVKRRQEYTYRLDGFLYLRDNHVSEKVVACAVCGSKNLEFEDTKQVRTRESGGFRLPFSPPNWKQLRVLWGVLTHPSERGERQSGCQHDTGSH